MNKRNYNRKTKKVKANKILEVILKLIKLTIMNKLNYNSKIKLMEISKIF